MGSIGWPELVLILVVVLVLFGGTRLAGLGKASGKAIREFKEETKDLKKDDPKAVEGNQQPTDQPQITVQPGDPQQYQAQQPYVQPGYGQQAQPQAPQQTGGQQPFTQPADPRQPYQQGRPSYDPNQTRPVNDPQQDQQPGSQQQ
ncbi:twin-arginine translocase TatA/TatE family subunit [Propionimicrobium sp. PCR01-08-3]|nr:twin-arginine translocase TatA/TatE family subunit [Propionimicrobium sp. PCR01-08-3]WIY81481.1 twin-arginine translocase TatA/TatE family subunit [Propionimicrobium sp. PCR01-08-3]